MEIYISKFYGLQPVFHVLLYAIENNQKVTWGFALQKFSYLYTIVNEMMSNFQVRLFCP